MFGNRVRNSLNREIPTLNYFRKEGKKEPISRDKVNECERNFGKYQEELCCQCELTE